MELSQKVKTTVTWVGQVLMGLIFILAGIGKLTGGVPVETRFMEWGYPGDFRFVVGTVEFLCGIALFIPRTARYAAFILIGVMIGAFFTHVINAEYGRLIINVAYASVLFGVSYSRGRISSAIPIE